MSGSKTGGTAPEQDFSMERYMQDIFPDPPGQPWELGYSMHFPKEGGNPQKDGFPRPALCGMIGDKHITMEGADMSIVGIILYDDAVIGFGDSKPTDGTGKHADTERPSVRKVFRADRFIITAYGANAYRDTPQSSVYLEDWFGKYAGKYRSPSELLGDLQESVYMYPEGNDGTYSFIVGGFDAYGPYMRWFSIARGTLSAGRKIRQHPAEARAFLGGSGYYANDMQAYGFERAVEEAGIEHAKEAVTECVSGLIRQGSGLGCYNPAGGNISVEILRA